MVVVKKRPFPYTKIPEDPKEAREYARSSTRHAKRPAQLFAKGLLDMGVTTGRILDVGTGSGIVALEIAKTLPNTEVIGLDLSEPLLDIARADAKAAGLTKNLIFKKGDAQEMPFEDNSFDTVVSLNTIHIVDSPVKMLNEVERILKPDGLAVLANIKRSWFGYIMPILKTTYTVSEMEELLKRSKLRNYRIEEHFLAFIIIAGEKQKA